MKRRGKSRWEDTVPGDVDSVSGLPASVSHGRVGRMRKFMTIAVAMLAVACSAKPHVETAALPTVAPVAAIKIPAGTFIGLHTRVAHRHAPVRVSRVYIRPPLYSHNWEALVRCEASGNWHINTGNGFYGGPQFTLETWYSHGGVGLPQNASKQLQIFVGEKVLADQGRGAWPNCGRYL